MRSLLLCAVVLAACSFRPSLPDLSGAKTPDDVRALLLPATEGHEMAEARSWLDRQGYACEPVEAMVAAGRHQLTCIGTQAAQEAQRGFRIVLLESDGRVQNVQVTAGPRPAK